MTRNSAFSIFEFLIVLGIFAIIGGISFFAITRFLAKSALESFSQNLFNSLTNARDLSIYRGTESSYGVKILEKEYIIFKGESFLAREQASDKVFQIPNNIEITGINEIIFKKLTGEPKATGEILISSQNNSLVILINKNGQIEFKK